MSVDPGAIDEPSNVVDLKAQVDARLEKAWARYAEARAIAERTCCIQDGIQAGLAWSAWLRLFEPMASRVIPMPSTGRRL